MKRFTAIFVIILLIISLTHAIQGTPCIELTIQTSNTTKVARKTRLLPTKEEQIDADAAALYQKAIQTLQQDYQPKQFSDWRRLPPDQLPVEQVESALEKLNPTLDLLFRATRSKQCNWPFVKPGQVTQQFMDDLSKYRQFAFILDVQIKLRIEQGRYDQAKETLKTSLMMAKHLGDAPTLVQGMVGIAIAALSQSRIEQWIQSDNAPNIYWALKDLPQTLVDVKKAIKIETDNLENYNFLLRWQFKKQLKPAHDMVLKQMNHVDRKIAALQCIEALRLYAGTHDGKLPQSLSDVTDIKIPVDPVTQKPFSYKSIGPEAVLELEATEGSDGRDAVQYELKLEELKGV